MLTARYRLNVIFAGNSSLGYAYISFLNSECFYPDQFSDVTRAVLSVARATPLNFN